MIFEILSTEKHSNVTYLSFATHSVPGKLILAIKFNLKYDRFLLQKCQTLSEKCYSSNSIMQFDTRFQCRFSAQTSKYERFMLCLFIQEISKCSCWKMIEKESYVTLQPSKMKYRFKIQTQNEGIFNFLFVLSG